MPTQPNRQPRYTPEDLYDTDLYHMNEPDPDHPMYWRNNIIGREELHRNQMRQNDELIPLNIDDSFGDEPLPLIDRMTGRFLPVPDRPLTPTEWRPEDFQPRRELPTLPPMRRAQPDSPFEPRVRRPMNLPEVRRTPGLVDATTQRLMNRQTGDTRQQLTRTRRFNRVEDVPVYRGNLDSDDEI